MFWYYRYNAGLLIRNILFDHRVRKSDRPLDLVAATLGFSTWPFFVDATDPRWNRGKITRLLMRYGIEVGGFGYHNKRFMFRVRRGQAHFAEQMLLRAGVPVVGKRLFSEDGPGQ